jgi:hypothetical protein
MSEGIIKAQVCLMCNGSGKYGPWVSKVLVQEYLDPHGRTIEVWEKSFTDEIECPNCNGNRKIFVLIGKLPVTNKRDKYPTII